MGYTNEFNLEVGATLNTTNIPKKLKELNADLKRSSSTKIPIEVVVSSRNIKNDLGKEVEEPILKTVKNIYKEVNIYKDKIGNTFKEIKYVDSKGNLFEDDKHKHQLIQTASALQTLTTETHKFVNTKGEIQNWTTSVDNLGKTVQTRTKQYINDTNQLVTETSEWGRNAQGQWQQLGNTIQKTQEIVRESTTSTSTVKGQIDDLGKSYQGLITTTEKVGTNGEYLRTVVSKYTDEMGRAVVKTEQFDKAGKQVATTMRQIGDAAKDSSSAKVTFIDENGVKKVTQMVDGVKTLTTTTREYTSAQGALVKETKTLNEVTGETKTYREVIKNKKQLAEESKKLQEQYKKEREERVKLEQGLVSSNTTQTRGKTKQFGDTSGREYDALITTLEKVDKNGQKTIQTTYEFINAQGKLVQQTRITDEEGKKLAQDTITIKDSISQATKAVEVLTTTTRQWGNSDGSVMKWTQTVDSAGNVVTKKVKEVVTGIGELTRTTQTAINGKNIGQAKTEIIEFADETQTSVNTVRGVINDLGKSYDGLITTTEKVSSNGEYLRTVVSKYTDETGRAVEVTDQFNKAGQKVATTMRKIGEAPQLKNTSTSTLINKDGTKIVTEYANGIATLRTETKQYTDTLGRLIQETNVYDEQTHKLISTHREELNNQKERLDKIAQEQQYKKQLTTTTKEVEQSIQREGESYKAVIKTIKEQISDTETLTTTITTYKNKQGELVVETEKVNQAGEHVAQTTRTVTKELDKAGSGAKKTGSGFKDLSDSAERANHGVKNLGWTLGDAISRLSNFYIASLPIRAVQTAITETITTVKEFDSALIEFRKVSDLAGESLTKYVAKLAEMGEVTGSTMQAMVEASTEFRKSGFTDEDSAQLASIAEKYRNIADEEISAGDSASFIIAQMKAFNIEAGQAEHIIDSVNEVANNFSVSSADLAKNLGNMSEIMAINNVSMEQQIGMLTGVTEITRNASSASRGLVMISSRLTQVLDDTSSTGKKLTAIYDKLGIELKDENGQLRSHYDILGDLAGVWDELSENEQKYIALTSAGARQQQNFVALMANWNQVAKATTTAYNSIGSAQKENEKVMDSIAKKLEILKSEFQQLVIGKGGLQDFAKNILDIGIALLKFANSDVGKAVLKMSAMVTAMALLNKGYKSLTASLLENAKAITVNSLVAHHAMTEEMAREAVKTMTLSDAIRINTKEILANAKALLTNPITWIGAILVGAIATVVKFNEVMEETRERIEEAKKTIAELTQEINLLNYSSKKESELSREEKDRLEYLEKRLKLEKQLLDVKEKSAKAREENVQFDFLNPYGQLGGILTAAWGSDEANIKRADLYGGNLSQGEQPNVWADVDETTLGKYEQLRQEIRLWNDYTDEGTKLLKEKQDESLTYLSSLEAERDELGKQRDAYNENNRVRQILLGYQSQGIPLTEAQKEKLKELTGVQEELNDRDKERLDVLENTIGKYQKNVEEITRFQEAVDEYGEGSEEADDILQDFAKDLGISETQLEANANALGLSIDAYYENAKAIKENDEALDYFQSALGTLQGAIDEYNESQYLSIDTIQSLLQLQPEYLAMLVDENGQLKLNEQAIVDKCNALIEEKKQTALQMAYDRLAAIERDNNSESAKNQSASIDGNTESLNIETAALSKNTVEQYANRIARNDKAKGTAASEVVRELERELAVLDKIGNNYTKISASAKKAGSAGKSAGKAAKDSAKEANKELEELIKKYEQVIKYINKRYDREIKKIKDAKSEAVKAEEKKIKAVEKEKDHALDAIEKEIKALKKEQDARKKYWSDRIDALKKQNDALKDSLELQEKLDALEKARNTKVKIYKEGQGFVYDVDQTAVAEAQKELDEYLSQKAYEDELERLEALKDAELDNYEKRLDALNEYKDSVQESYEKQIEQMNEYKDKLSEEYDAQIEIWEKYKSDFGDLVDQYEEEQNKLLFEQLMGIKDENSNWLTRLDNLAEFVRKYNELQKQLNTGNTSVTNTATMKEGTGGGSGTRGTRNVSTTPTTSVVNASSSQTSSGKGIIGSRDLSQSTFNNSALEAARKRAGVKTHANGTPSVKSDEIAVVGENPNKEIVIGSKINNGELMNLGKGTGVVNADSSKTLAGMLNQVGQFGASGFGSGNGTLNSNINNDTLTINGVTIQGSNIKDPETFVNGLLNLKAEALQRAYKHR